MRFYADPRRMAWRANEPQAQSMPLDCTFSPLFPLKPISPTRAAECYCASPPLNTDDAAACSETRLAS